MNTIEIEKRFKEIRNKYVKLGANLKQAFELLVSENNIPYVSISYRVKENFSFIEKIQRKNYADPFNEIEDICGLRIICYYQSDTNKIGEIITKEFNVLEQENKSNKIDDDKFGYRSLHYIAKVKNEWLATPNYRGLENLKCEIQVRTILMHAWAEIEHKLAYKSKSQIPSEYRRKLSRISAKLEETDEQFEEIKTSIDTNNKNLLKTVNALNKFDTSVEYNLDNLQVLLDFKLSERKKSLKDAGALFKELITYDISFEELSVSLERTQSILEEVEFELDKKLFSLSEYSREEFKPYWNQVGACRASLELTNDRFFDYTKEFPGADIFIKFRQKLTPSS